MIGQYVIRSAYLPDVPECPLVSLRYKKDLIKWLDKEGYTLDDVEITIKEVLEPLNVCLHAAKSMMTNIEAKFKGATLYFSDGDNYREAIAKEVPYKGKRWSQARRDTARANGEWLEWLDETEAKYKPPVRPFWEKQIKEYLKKNYSYVSVLEQEADDALGIAQTAGKGKTCIVSIDKDLKMIKGYNQNLTELDEKTIRIKPFEAELNFYGQLLTGDVTDSIPGIKGIGTATRDKILIECETKKELMITVWKKYIEKYPNSTHKELYNLITQRGQLLWIRRKENEMWKPSITLNTLTNMTPQV